MSPCHSLVKNIFYIFYFYNQWKLYNMIDHIIIYWVMVIKEVCCKKLNTVNFNSNFEAYLNYSWEFQSQTHLSPLRSSSWSKVAICLAPVQPRGCPKAMAPPFGFTLSAGISSLLTQYAAWLAKASLISNTSMSSILRPKNNFLNVQILETQIYLAANNI